MATTITKTTNLIKIKTSTDLERCYSLNSGYKFASKQSYLTTDSDAIIFTIGGESFDIICANGISINGSSYTTLALAYPALIAYLA